MSPTPHRPLRVLLDASFALRSPLSGTGVYVEQILAALGARADVEVIAVADRHRPPPAGGGVQSVRNAARDARWMGVELPRLARRHQVDLIHHPLPAFAPGADRPQVVTVHDLSFLIVPQAFALGFRTWAACVHGRAARMAAGVICVSDTTAADVRSRWQVPATRITVARHGPGQLLAAVPRVAPAHFLYVGDGEPRKNVPLLLDAYRYYRQRTPGEPLDLVLAGSAEGHGPGVSVERDPSRERLTALHAAAAALVHPARHEGFGLTLLESMAMGTPVIAIGGGAVGDVCGDAAWIAGSDPSDLGAAMATLAADPRCRERLARAGQARVAQFSWSTAAERHVEAYVRAAAAYSCRDDDEDRNPRYARHPRRLQWL